MKTCVFDIEGDSLNPTKIHCLVAAIYSNGQWRSKTTTDYDEMRKFFKEADVIIGHNIMRWDMPNIERLLNIKYKGRIIDTLALSWYLYPDKLIHGLDDWGTEFGIPKPKITDWEGLSIEEYCHRCEEDVKINCKLWDKQWRDLTNLYEDDEDEVNRFIDYLMFKMDCAREAERSRWRLDVDRAQSVLAKLELIKEEKEEELTKAMPKVPIKKKMNYPAKPYKKDGSLSATGERWFELLHRLGLPEDTTETVEYEDGFKEPNPNSHVQIKDWLFSLGWQPEAFTYKKEKGSKKVRKIPQIRVDKKDEKVLCPSVVDLFEQEPSLEVLEGLSVISHRISILKGFLENVDDEGFIKAEIQGFTNTLRFKHKIVVNLPNVRKPYGEDIRGCLISRDGYELCGSDMSSLEDRTKQHYMWNYDPEYVKEMMTDDFDPHLDLAILAGFLTEEQAEEHKLYGRTDGKEGVNHSAERAKAKTANYACVYGAVGATVARGAKIPVEEGEALVEKYWDRNWSVHKIAEDQKVKDALGGMWLFNPVSKFWYSLRYDKDRFSTLNQGTGVYCFDKWIMNFRKKRPQLTGQMHDEVILEPKKGYRKQCELLLREAITETNEELKLNRELDIDVQFGDNYAQIH